MIFSPDDHQRKRYLWLNEGRRLKKKKTGMGSCGAEQPLS